MANDDDLFRRKGRFWVKSNPGEEFPGWHDGPCYMEVEWDYELQRLPKRNKGGVASFATARNVALGS